MSPETTALAPAAALPVPPAIPLGFDNRFLGPILITCILIAAHLSFGILEGYERTALAIVTAIVAEMVLGRLTYGRWPHLGKRLHHRHQRRDPGPLAVPLAVCARQPDLDCVEVRPAAERAAPLEPVEFRRQRRAVSRARDGVAAQHPVGQHRLADGR